MGAYGSERTTQSLQDFPVVDSEEEAEEVTGSLEAGWAGSVICVCVRSCTVSLHVAIAPVTGQAGGWAAVTNGLEPVDSR